MKLWGSVHTAYEERGGVYRHSTHAQREKQEGGRQLLHVRLLNKERQQRMDLWDIEQKNRWIYIQLCSD